MIDDLIRDATTRMDKSVEATHNELNTIRTGRASAALLDRITVQYYEQPTPLKQLATINVPEPRMLTVQPFDPSSIKDIERAIQESDLGLTPCWPRAGPTGGAGFACPPGIWSLMSVMTFLAMCPFQ